MAALTLISPADGCHVPAYHAPPKEARRGGLVILHALWGVTPHIRELCDAFSAEGYETLAPSLMERQDPGFAHLNIDPERFEARQAAMTAASNGGACWPDVQAAIDALKPPVMLMGFCFGGSAAWVAACRCEGLSAAACFYGGHIVAFNDLQPRCPTILHFGRLDQLIPPEDVAAIEAAHPDIPLWLYDAGHAFVAPNAYNEDAAGLALLRTRQLFHRASTAYGREPRVEIDAS